MNRKQHRMSRKFNLSLVDFRSDQFNEENSASKSNLLPNITDQYYINKFSFPKGLKCSGARVNREE